MNANMVMAFEVANTFIEDFTIDSRITTQKRGSTVIIDVIKNKKNQHIFIYLIQYLFKLGFRYHEMSNWGIAEDGDYVYTLGTPNGIVVVRMADATL